MLSANHGLLFLAGVVVLLLTPFSRAQGVKEIWKQCSAEFFRVIDEEIPGSHDWLSWDNFTKTYVKNKEIQEKWQVIGAEVSNVPCLSHGCCNMLFHFRPGTTDLKVLYQVFVQKFFTPISERLDAIEPKYILDGGANVGFASTRFAMMYPNASIIAVEPNEGNFDILKINTHRFPNVHPVRAGLWDQPTYIVLNAMDREWGYMFKNSDVPSEDSVKGMTIPQLMREFNFPWLDFVKIDIEGAESKVFHPNADQSWIDHTKLISIETHDRMAKWYGLDTVADIVLETMANYPFSSFLHGEHTFFLRNQDKHHRHHA